MVFSPPPPPLFAVVWATAFLGSTAGGISLWSLHHAPSPELNDVKQDRWTNSVFWKLVTERTCQNKHNQECTDNEAPSVSQVVIAPESRLRLSSASVHEIQWERAQKQIYFNFSLGHWSAAHSPVILRDQWMVYLLKHLQTKDRTKTRKAK